MHTIINEDPTATNNAVDSKTEEVAELNGAELSTPAATSEEIGSGSQGELSKDDAPVASPQEASVFTDKQEALPEAKPKITTGMAPVELLHPYAKNSEIYKECDDPLFEENIQLNGVMNPLVVTEDGSILGGNRRWRGAKKVGLAEVPVVVVACKSEDEKLQRLLDDNLYREKTNEEKIREYIAQKKIEGRKGALRKAENGKKTAKPDAEVEKFTPPASKKNGKARDLAAEKFHLTGVSAEKGRKVVEAADKLRKEGDPKTADELLAKLEEGYDPALKLAIAYGFVEKPGGKAGSGGQTKAKKGKGNAPATSAPGEHHPTVGKDAADAPKAAAPESESKGKPKDQDEDEGTQTPPKAPDVEDELTDVDQLIASMNKNVDGLEALDAGGLPILHKLGLQRVHKRESDWYSDHEEMLKLPNQL